MPEFWYHKRQIHAKIVCTNSEVSKLFQRRQLNVSGIGYRLIQNLHLQSLMGRMHTCFDQIYIKQKNSFVFIDLLSSFVCVFLKEHVRWLETYKYCIKSV